MKHSIRFSLISLVAAVLLTVQPSRATVTPINNGSLTGTLNLGQSSTTGTAVFPPANLGASSGNDYGFLSGTGTFKQPTALNAISSIALLRSQSVAGLANGSSITVSGYYTANDGGGGVYVWNSTSTAADNGGSIIAPTGVSTGRWLLTYAGTLNARCFGAKGDGVNNDVPNIQAMIAAGVAVGTPRFYFPAGTYLMGDGYGSFYVSLNDINGAEFYGDAGKTTLKLANGVARGSCLFGSGIGHPFSNCYWHDFTVDLNGANNLQTSFGDPLRLNSFIYGFSGGISDVRIERVTVLNASGSQVIRLSDDTSTVSNRVTIRNCIFNGFGQGVSGNQQQDVSVIYVFGNNVQVQNCTFTNPSFTMNASQGQTAIEFHSGYGTRVDHNLFYNVQLPVLTASDQGDVVDMEICDNDFQNTLYAATLDPGGSNAVHRWIFARNQFTSTQNFQIGMIYIGATNETAKTRDGIEINDNQFYVSGVTGSGRSCVMMVNSDWTNVSIQRNRFVGLTAQAIHMEGVPQGTNAAQLIIRNNVFDSCGGIGGSSPFFPTDGTPSQLVLSPSGGTWNLISIGENVFANTLGKNYTALGHVYLGASVSSNIIDVHDNLRPQDTYTLVDDLSTATGTKYMVNGGLVLTNNPQFNSIGIGAAASGTAGNIQATSATITNATVTNATLAAVSLTSNIQVSGSGATPTASSLGIGTNGAGSRWVYNAPTGGEHDFTINGTTVGGASANGLFVASGKDLQLGQTYTVSATAATGYIAVKDSSGTTYYLRCSTTP